MTREHHDDIDGTLAKRARVAGNRGRERAALFELLAERKIEPFVAERIPLVQARRAHENLGHGGITGKQILICDERPWEEQNATAEGMSRKAV
jgi:D-arabinose 1-dehydrogenase-like Zn-dependent alcohol dehydrogenase